MDGLCGRNVVIAVERWVFKTLTFVVDSGWNTFLADSTLKKIGFGSLFGTTWNFYAPLVYLLAEEPLRRLVFAPSVLFHSIHDFLKGYHWISLRFQCLPELFSEQLLLCFQDQTDRPSSLPYPCLFTYNLTERWSNLLLLEILCYLQSCWEGIGSWQSHYPLESMFHYLAPRPASLNSHIELRGLQVL